MAREEETSPSATLDRSFRENSGAEEGTRTPTPLRVHGPEPCASANSATSALCCARPNPALRREILIYFKGFAECVKPRTPSKSRQRGVKAVPELLYPAPSCSIPATCHPEPRT